MRGVFGCQPLGREDTSTTGDVWDDEDSVGLCVDVVVAVGAVSVPPSTLRIGEGSLRLLYVEDGVYDGGT